MTRSTRTLFRVFGLLTFVIALNLSIALPVMAQVLLGTETQLTVAISPQHPVPGDTVQLTLLGASDIQNDTVTWRGNGKVIAQGEGIDSATVTAGALGQKTTISVSVTGADSGVANATFTPTRVDLLWEADSYTPPFYRGRALPTAGTKIRLQAIPHLVRSNGSIVPSDQIIYTWKMGNAILTDLSGRGKSIAVVDAPFLYDTATISVDAISSDRSLAGSAHVAVTTAQPTLRLYMNHPLYGVAYNSAITGTTYVPDTEMGFMGTPYFVNQPGAAKLGYEWAVNGKTVSPNSSHPDTITINASNSFGSARIQLRITDASNYFFDASGVWNITFRANTSSQTDLFRGQ